ncbi:hypothetical protein J6590_092456 [Homalodisca vitripennis]|nr:hypothetical protein J6590_092456 [Homalodisca vitripennis]
MLHTTMPLGAHRSISDNSSCGKNTQVVTKALALDKCRADFGIFVLSSTSPRSGAGNGQRCESGELASCYKSCGRLREEQVVVRDRGNLCRYS